MGDKCGIAVSSPLQDDQGGTEDAAWGRWQLQSDGVIQIANLDRRLGVGWKRSQIKKGK